ncbi:hypothetical protein [Paraclostridium bifermentans]|nr:hypothetical protein [Paraclostridium bifermentans]
MKKLLSLFLCLAVVLNMATATFKTTKFQENICYSDINVEKDVEDL